MIILWLLLKNGTTEIERILIGELSDIVQRVERRGFANPAIIVFGEVLRGIIDTKQLSKQLPLELIKKQI